MDVGKKNKVFAILLIVLSVVGIGYGVYEMSDSYSSEELVLDNFIDQDSFQEALNYNAHHQKTFVNCMFYGGEALCWRSFCSLFRKIKVQS